MTSSMIQQSIKACPHLTAELMPGSRDVQKYYSKVEQRYDNSIKCSEDNVCPTYVLIPMSGAVCGILAATVTTIVANDGHALIYFPTIVSISAAVPSLSYHIGRRIYNYCRTKPEDRYAIIHIRDIAVPPKLLDLIADVVDSDPEQEQ